MAVEFDDREEKEIRSFISEMVGEGRRRDSATGAKSRAKARTSFNRYTARQERQKQRKGTGIAKSVGRRASSVGSGLVSRAVPVALSGGAVAAAGLIVLNKRLTQLENSYNALTQSRGRLASQQILDDLGRRIIDEATKTFKSGDARGLWDVMQVTAAAGKKELGAALKAVYKLIESVIDGNELERALSDAAQAYWRNTRRIHPKTRETLKILKNRFDRQQETGDFVGGWKNPGLIGS